MQGMRVMGILLGWGWRMGGGSGRPRVRVVGNSGGCAVMQLGSAKYLSVFPFSLFYLGLSHSFIVLVLDIHRLERGLHKIIYLEFIVDSFESDGL